MNNSINILLLNEIKNIAKEKNIEPEKIKGFLTDAIKRIYNKVTYEDNLIVEMDLQNGEMITNKTYVVVEDDFADYDESIHIKVSSALAKQLGLKVGDIFEEHFDISREFNQHQVQQIMQYFKQKITEISNQRVYESWSPMKNEIILAEIEKEDKKSNFYTINLEDQYDKNDNHLEPTLGFIGNKDLNPFETLDVRKKYLFVVVDVKEQSKFCPVILSRTSEKLVEHFLTLEVPEIDDGTIKIVKSARQAGIKTKILVDSKTLPIEPANVCVGPRGERVKNVSNQLNGEKIEIYNYSKNPYELLSKIVTKNNLLKIAIDEVNKKAVLVVSNDELARAIGKRGCNVKLASIVSGYSINVITAKDEHEYSDMYFVHVNSEEFKKYASEKTNDVVENKEIIEDTTVQPIDLEDIDEIMSDLDTNELNDVFKDEVDQILSLENEKTKL